MSLGILVLISLLVAGLFSGRATASLPDQGSAGIAGCASARPRVLLGLVERPLTLTEMVSRLERGCLALPDVRFRPGQDTIESLSPSRFALMARALGMAQGAYRIVVPAEGIPGLPPDTLQARRRGMRLRDELVHYGSSARRLVEDSGWPAWPLVVPPGSAVPMLVRVPDP